MFLYFLLLLLCTEPRGHNFLDLKNAKFFVQMIFFIIAYIMDWFLQPAPAPEHKIKAHIAIKGFLRPRAHFREDCPKADTMERWSKVSEYSFKPAIKESILGMGLERSYCPFIFVTFSALLSIIAHRFLLFATEGIYFGHSCLQKRQFSCLAFCTG